MAMKDEEKARELALEMGQEDSFMYSHAMSILTKMAAWKKQQIIEKAEKWMKKNHVHYINTNIPTEQLIEDFKQSMAEE